MRKAAFVIFLFFAFLPAFAQDAVPDSVQSEAPVAAEPAPVAEASAVEIPAPEKVESVKVPEKVAAPADVKSAEMELEKSPVAEKPAKKSGLLDALFPVEPDEYISRGHFYGGTSLSLIQANTEDDALNILIGDVYEAYGYTFTVEAFGGYFIRDAMALGLRAGYSRTWFDVDFSILEDLMDVKERRKYVSNGFFVQPLLKNYLKVLDSRIFYLFNETSVLVEYSYGISQTDNGEDLKKTRNRGWSIEAGINPGICIMVLDRFAFETSVGLLGLSSSIIDVEENDEVKSRVVYNVVNFTINLLALKFSLVTFF